MVEVDLFTLLMGKLALANKLEDNPTKQDEVFDFILDALIEEKMNFETCPPSDGPDVPGDENDEDGKEMGDE